MRRHISPQHRRPPGPAILREVDESIDIPVRRKVHPVDREPKIGHAIHPLLHRIESHRIRLPVLVVDHLISQVSPSVQHQHRILRHGGPIGRRPHSHAAPQRPVRYPHGRIHLVEQNPADGGHHAVRHPVNPLGHQIPRPTLRIPNLEMEVRPARRPGISEKGDPLSFPHRKPLPLRMQVHPERPLGILLLPHPPGNLRRKSVQMAVHRGLAVRMGHIQHMSVPRRRHPHPRHIPVSHGINRTPDTLQRLDIQPRMEVIRPNFADIPGQRNGKPHRRPVVLGAVPFRESLSHACDPRNGHTKHLPRNFHLVFYLC